MLIVLLFVLAEIFISAMLGCSEAPQAPPFQRSNAINRFMEHQLTVQSGTPNKVFDQPAQGFDPRFYPAEAAISFWCAWQDTKRQDFYLAAERQCAWAHSLQSKDGVFVPSPFGYVSRLSQARLIIGYYVAYRFSRDQKYLTWMDETMSGFLKLPLEPISYNGRTFLLFNYAYSPAPPYLPQSTTRLNPNQESAIALAMTILFFQPGSKFHFDSRLESIAWEHLDASLTLQNNEGQVSSHQDELNIYDTRYGGYTLFNWCWANQFWNSARLDSAIQKGAKWIASIPEAETNRYYPERFEGSVPDPIELWLRIPLLWTNASAMKCINKALDECISRWPTYGDLPGGFACPASLLEMAFGIPHEQLYTS